MLLFLLACSPNISLDKIGEPTTGLVTDSTISTAPITGDYAGDVAGTFVSDNSSDDCPGTAELTVDDSGFFVGSAQCTSEVWGLLEGDLDGTALGGEISGSWNVSLQEEAVPLEITGLIADGVFDGVIDYQSDVVTFSAELTLTMTDG